MSAIERVTGKEKPDRLRIENRFWEKVDHDSKSDDECWQWTASTDRDGYGRFKIDENNCKAHRVALALDDGEIKRLDEFGIVRHSCDNPACCNPAHLREGTQKDNMRDMSERGRASNQTLDAEDAREIKQRYRDEDITQYELADEFNVKQGSIAAIINEHSFKHVD